MTRKSFPRRWRDRAAFTLMEMLIVIALIALLAGVAIYNVGGMFEGGREDLARTMVNGTFKSALTSFNVRMGRYPNSSEGLQALITRPEQGGDRWSGPYLDSPKVPDDPWGRPYQYRYPGTKNPSRYDVFSFGKDGVESADDIGNW